MSDYIYERFNSIYDFEKALNTRKASKLFKIPASQKVSFNGWYQTRTYEEAEDLLDKGWNAKLEDMKVELKKFSNSIQRTYSKQFKNIAGYAPCVPNAIRGVPKSMIASKKMTKQEKKRCVHIVVNNTECSGISGEELMECGMTVLKFCTVLDKKNIKTKLEVIPKMSEAGDSIYGCSVMIKDYQQPFNLSKVAYPIAHVGFFRRHGFRWLETCNGKNLQRYIGTYGHSMAYAGERNKQEYFKYAGFMKEGTIYIDFSDVKKAGFDWKKLAENKGIAIA